MDIFKEIKTTSLMNIIMNSSQECRMAQGIHRWPRTSLSIFVIILEGVKKALKILTRSTINSLVFFTARYRGHLRTATKVKRIKAPTFQSVLSTGYSVSKRPTKLSGRLDNKSLAFNHVKPFKPYKTTSCSYFYAATSYSSEITGKFSYQNIDYSIMISVNSDSFHKGLAPNFSVILRYHKKVRLDNSSLISVKSDRDLLGTIHILRNHVFGVFYPPSPPH